MSVTYYIFIFSFCLVIGGENIDSDEIEDMIEKGDLNAFTHKMVTIYICLLYFYFYFEKINPYSLK